MPDTPKILIVDDEVFNRSLIVRALEEGYELITACNGREAIDILQREAVDLVIMDVMMPVMDGLDATRLIKGDPRYRGVPVIMVTALGNEKDFVAGIEAGADDYVEKPFNIKILRARVKAHIRAKMLYDELERARRDQEIIIDITSRTTSALHIREVLHILATKLADRLNLDRCAIILVNEDQEHGLVVASSDDPKIGGLCIYIDKYPEIQAVVKSMKPLVIDDVNTAPIMAEVREKVNLPFKSMMVVPIIFKEEVIGTFILRASKRNESFTEREIELGRVIANASSNAIKNASLFEKIEERNEELERANKRLRKLDELKNTFLGAAAHELRTPLSVINGYLEMLLEKETGGLNARQVEMVSSSIESLRGLVRMVDEMLDLSVIESGQLPLKIEKARVSEPIRRAVDLVGKIAVNKNIEIISECSSAEALFDRERIEQVIINLLTNAIKFTPEGGKVSVECREGMDFITVGVRDTGRGINQAELDRVFDEFFRSRGKDGGAGLGLSICKKIVERHGGRIWVESSEGKGSTFSFMIPKISSIQRHLGASGSSPQTKAQS